MARQNRVYFKNAVYHVCVRGNNRHAVLRGDENKLLFLHTLSKFKSRLQFKLYGFVLMDNHAHIIIEAHNTVNISRIMQSIALSYSVQFRKRYSYTGYVWQGRFKSNVIDNDRYILECIDYIHRNPIRAGIVDEIEEYPWSSYGFYNNLNSQIDAIIKIDELSF